MVVFDFRGIESIGQAFADEISRVFAKARPDIELIESHTGVEVKNMILRARSSGDSLG